MMDIKEGLLLWFINFLRKILLRFQINLYQEVVLIRMEMIKLNKIRVFQTCLHINQLNNYTNQLLEDLKKITVYSRSKINIWGAYLANMQLISKFNKGFRFLLYVIDIFSKYASVVPLKDMLFTRSQINHDVNKTKHGLITEAHFTIILSKNGKKVMILKCI